jgi:hypothetical protein
MPWPIPEETQNKMDPGVMISDVPPPVLFNTWKHHAGALRRRIAQVVQIGPEALETLPNRLLAIGTDLMDLYTGALSPSEIADWVVAWLRKEIRLDSVDFRAWVETTPGYQVATLPDSSRWVLRWGTDVRYYIHLHPARWSPRTCRVRANVLKTAVMTLAFAGIHKFDPLDLPIINRVRQESLGLSPIGALVEGAGLKALIGLLAKNENAKLAQNGFAPLRN